MTKTISQIYFSAWGTTSTRPAAAATVTLTRIHAPEIQEGNFNVQNQYYLL